MDPTTSFVLALLALLVALGSLIVSIVSAVSTARARPKVEWVTKANELRPTGNDGWMWVFEVTNHGLVAATDVELALVTRQGHRAINHWASREQDAGVDSSISVPSEIVVLLQNPLTPRGSFEFELSWRQPPRGRRKRRMRFFPKTTFRAN